MAQPDEGGSPASRPGKSSNFHTTRWSLIASAGSADAPDADAAMQELCSLYWYPLYALVRRRGYDAHAAEDLTQSFFAHLLERRAVGSADPNRGRFRSYLLKSLENYLANERQRSQAQKRGGGTRLVSFDLGDAENRYLAEPAADVSLPEHAFDRGWAMTVLDQALREVRESYRRSGAEGTFDALKSFLTSDGAATGPAYEQARTQLGISPEAARAAVYRLRGRYREALRQTIAQTLACTDDSAIDEEIRDLFRALSA